MLVAGVSLLFSVGFFKVHAHIKKVQILEIAMGMNGETKYVRRRERECVCSVCRTCKNRQMHKVGNRQREDGKRGRHSRLSRSDLIVT